MRTFYEIAKLLHIIGFITAIGVTLATLIAYTQFWKLYDTNNEQGAAAFRSFSQLQTAGMIGLFLALLGGIIMLALAHWSFTALLWFKIKMGLVILILVNGFTLGRTTSLRLSELIAPDHRSDEDARDVQSLRRRLNVFLVLQLGIYAAIIILSVFRFG